jgi:hypothetical protein
MDEKEIKSLRRRFASPLDSYATSPTAHAASERARARRSIGFGNVTLSLTPVGRCAWNSQRTPLPKSRETAITSEWDD